MLKNKKLTNIILYFSLALLGMYMSVFQRSLEDIGGYYKMIEALMGIMVSVHFSGIFLVPLIMGELADKFGRKLFASLSFFLLFAGLLVIVLTSNVYLFLIGVFMVGGGFGIVEGMVTTLLVDINTEQNIRVINFSQAFFCIGALLGPLLTSYFLSQGYNWKSLYSILAVVSLFYVYYIWKLDVDNFKIGSAKIEGSITIQLLTKPVLVLLALTIFMYVGIEQGVAFWMTTYARTIGNSLVFPSIFLSVFWGFMVVGRFAIGLVNEKVDLIMIIIGLTVFSLISLLLVIWSHSYLMATIAFSLLGLGLSSIWPLIMSVSDQRFGQYRATTFGIMMASSALGGMVVPFIAGYISNMTQIRVGMAFFIIPLLVILWSQYLIKKREKVGGQYD